MTRSLAVVFSLALALAGLVRAQETAEPALPTAGATETGPAASLAELERLQESFARPQPLSELEAETTSPPPRGPDDEITAAVERYLATGDAATLKRSDTILFPFEESQPVVRCSPLRACDIELQAGEVVTGVALGAPELWIANPLQSGDPSAPVPHVIVKPKAYDLATNLIIATTRRTYHLGLISPAKTDVTSGEIAYYRHVAFYYPNDLVQQWASLDDLAVREADRRAAAIEEPLAGFSVEDLNFAYSIDADKKASFRPSLVFDDGRHVYIRLSPAARSADLPALLVESPTGELAIANYRVRGVWYIVNGLFERGRLVVGVGKKQRKVEIVSHRPQAAGA